MSCISDNSFRVWYRYGLQHGNDFIEKFIMHWIAFNMEYANSIEPWERETIIKKKAQTLEIPENKIHIGELDEIEEYCKKKNNILKKYNPIRENLEQYLVLAEKPIKQTNGNSHEEENIKRNENLKKYNENDFDSNVQAIIDILSVIYQIRCNLFHGGKSPNLKRDLKLVEASAVILEGYMKILVGDVGYDTLSPQEFIKKMRDFGYKDKTINTLFLLYSDKDCFRHIIDEIEIFKMNNNNFLKKDENLLTHCISKFRM